MIIIQILSSYLWAYYIFPFIQVFFNNLLYLIILITFHIKVIKTLYFVTNVNNILLNCKFWLYTIVNHTTPKFNHLEKNTLLFFMIPSSGWTRIGNFFAPHNIYTTQKSKMAPSLPWLLSLQDNRKNWTR